MYSFIIRIITSWVKDFHNMHKTRHNNSGPSLHCDGPPAVCYTVNEFSDCLCTLIKSGEVARDHLVTSLGKNFIK